METTGRLLSLLSVLQSRPVWSGPALATRLGVTVRTVRRDIDRLRGLGYAIESDLGVAGGYRLGAGGAHVPPLMLDDDEAVALALCVRSAAGDSVVGVGDAAGRALAKLEQTMPSRLRSQLAALSMSTERLPGAGDGSVDPEVLVTVSRACRERDVLHLDYRDSGGRQTERRVEPWRVVNAGRRWYLVAYDQRRHAPRATRADPSDHSEHWRTFRLDRIAAASPTGHRFERVDPPDPVQFVQRAISTAPYRYRARIEFDAPLADLAAQIPSTVGVLDAIDDDTTVFTTGADDLDFIALHVARLGLPFRVVEPAALRERLSILADRLWAAAGDDRADDSG